MKTLSLMNKTARTSGRLLGVMPIELEMRHFTKEMTTTPFQEMMARTICMVVLMVLIRLYGLLKVKKLNMKLALS